MDISLRTIIISVFYFITVHFNYAAQSAKVQTLTGSGIVGLDNPKNRCYLNASLQTLRGIPALTTTLGHLPPDSYQANSVGASYQQFIKTYDQHTQQSEKSFNSDIVYEALKGLYQQECSALTFDVGLNRQEDAAELMASLLGAISSDRTVTASNPFALHETRSTRCKNCGDHYESVYDAHKFDTQLTLDLLNCINSTNNGIAIPLEECLNAYFQERTVTKQCLNRCSQQNPTQHLQKVSNLQQAPPILCIVLKRFAFENENNSTKIRQRVTLPNQLNLTAFMENEDASAQYQLVSCVMHKGEQIQSGHYVAYVKGSNNAWYLCNDQSITEMDHSFSINHTPEDAYIVFYQNTATASVSSKKEKVSSPAPAKFERKKSVTIPYSWLYQGHMRLFGTPQRSMTTLTTIAVACCALLNRITLYRTIMALLHHKK